MKKIAIVTGVATAALVGGALAYGALAAPKSCCPSTSDKASMRADCPGTIICPLTGEEICKDKCPLCAKQAE